MRTLYLSIVLKLMVISFFSGLLAFVLSNVYYQFHLKEYNERKVLRIADEIVNIYNQEPNQDLDTYFTNVSKMNFQITVYDNQYHKKIYGDPFRLQQIEKKYIDEVLRGKTYHGISTYKDGIFVTGFFKSDIKNSVGVPLYAHGKNYAIFVRPNIEAQFGEARILFGMLVVLTILFSVMFILIGTRYIVRPIQRLTTATQKISKGHYDIELNIKRTDEIGELARHFSFMAASLKKLDDMRQEFVSNVSHEVQSPLTSIKGFAKALQSSNISEEQRNHYLAIIEKEAERVSDLSRQLLLLSALDKEAQRVKKAPLRLDEHLREVVISMEWQWSQKEIMMDMDLAEVSIYADAALLYQVWVNLITNAIKFTDQGGVIRIGLNEQKSTVTVTISDTGCGIPEEELNHIFERFYKVDKARNRKIPGSGLGLSIVKTIVSLHGGEISVSSELHKGTTFTIRLPKM